MSIWIENDRYFHVKAYIKQLCREYELPCPMIQKEDDESNCDFTSISLIRLQCKNGISLPSYKDHAIHVFGHYLCNLEQDDNFSDRVVGVITNGIQMENDKEST